MRYSKAIVTGGAGFIGSHLVKKLVAHNVDVLVIDNLSRGQKDNLRDVEKKIIFINTNLTQHRNLPKLFSPYEVIFHLAALNTGIDFDSGKEQQTFEENMLLQMLPLRAAAQTPSIKRFLQISSASIYSREMMNVGKPMKETEDSGEPEPSKIGYALAKKMGERLAVWYAQNTPLETVRARFINVYGENDHFDDLGHFIPVITKKILLSKNSVHAFGDGKQKRSFLYVDDAVNALLLLMEKGRNGDVYNIDAEDEHSVKDVIESIKKIAHKEQIKIMYDKTQPTGSTRRILDSSKIRSLGWTPQTRFEKGLQKTVADIAQKIHHEHH